MKKCKYHCDYGDGENCHYEGESGCVNIEQPKKTNKECDFDKDDIKEPSEYMVLLYSPKKSDTDECVINAVTVTVRVDPAKKINYGTIERKAKEYLKPMGVEFRASSIQAVGFYPRAGY